MILPLNSGFIGSFHNQVLSFLPSIDSEDRFLKNLKDNPDWIYKNIDIEYKFNEYGHRSISMDNLNDDYILYSGCSHSFGAGHKVEHTYPHIVSDFFNKDYYNLSMCGTGPDVQMHNLIAFVTKMKDKLPSTVVIQWANFYRFSTFNGKFDNSQMFNFYHLGMTNDSDGVFRYFTKQNIAYNNNVLNRYFTLNVLKNMGIKNIVEIIEPDNEVESNVGTVKVPFKLYSFNRDFARDMAHSGIESHKLQSDVLIGEIKKF